MRNNVGGSVISLFFVKYGTQLKFVLSFAY
jgi:hypothetical protein